MRTSNLFSTISYVSPNLMESKCRVAVKNCVLDFWAFIQHQPDEDYSKPHIHAIFRPSKLMQTQSFLDDIKEFDPHHPALPLACMPARSSKRFGDWYFYCVHNPYYLAARHETRNLSYQESDFIASDKDYFHDLVRCLVLRDYLPTDKLLNDLAEQNVPLTALLASGDLSLARYNSVARAYNDLRMYYNFPVAGAPDALDYDASQARVKDLEDKQRQVSDLLRAKNEQIALLQRQLADLQEGNPFVDVNKMAVGTGMPHGRMDV